MRTIKFEPRLVPLLYPTAETGLPAKTATWRLGDKYADNPYSEGEQVVLCGNGGMEEPIAVARIAETFRKPFADLTPAEKEGHETYPDADTMYATFQSYYPEVPVGPQTEVTVAKLQTLVYIAVLTADRLVLIEPDF